MDWPLNNFLAQRCRLLLSTLMYMPVVPAKMTRNERHLSQFRNNMSLAFWSWIWSCNKDSVQSIAKFRC